MRLCAATGSASFLANPRNLGAGPHTLVIACQAEDGTSTSVNIKFNLNQPPPLRELSGVCEEGGVCRCEEGGVCRCEEGGVCKCEEGGVCRCEEGGVCKCEGGGVCKCEEGGVCKCGEGGVCKYGEGGVCKCEEDECSNG